MIIDDAGDRQVGQRVAGEHEQRSLRWSAAERCRGYGEIAQIGVEGARERHPPLLGELLALLAPMHRDVIGQ